MKDTNANSAEQGASGATPGVILKAAREEQGWSAVDVATRLCLNVQYIEDIERDDYSHMSARVYARGHVLAYAHLLGIPESQILPALVNVNMHFEPLKVPSVSKENEQSIPIYQTIESRQSRPGVLLWVSVLVLIILVGLVLMWWKGSLENKASNGQAAKSTEVNIQPQNTASPGAPAPAPAASEKAAPPLPPPASSDAAQPGPGISAPSSTPADSGTSANPPAQDQTAVQPSEIRDTHNSNDSQAPSVNLPPPTSTDGTDQNAGGD